MNHQTIGPELVTTTKEPGQEALPSENNVIPIRGRPEGVIQGDKPVLVEPSIYELVFLYHETATLFRTGKLICHFRIVTDGKYRDEIVQRYYNATISGKKRRKGGAFTVGWKSDFVREYTRLFGSPSKGGISTAAFKNGIFKGRVTPVIKSSTNKVIPKEAQYSVVSELLEKIQ